MDKTKATPKSGFENQVQDRRLANQALGVNQAIKCEAKASRIRSENQKTSQAKPEQIEKPQGASVG